MFDIFDIIDELNYAVDNTLNAVEEACSNLIDFAGDCATAIQERYEEDEDGNSVSTIEEDLGNVVKIISIISKLM